MLCDLFSLAKRSNRFCRSLKEYNISDIEIDCNIVFCFFDQLIQHMKPIPKTIEIDRIGSLFESYYCTKFDVTRYDYNLLRLALCLTIGSGI